MQVITIKDSESSRFNDGVAAITMLGRVCTDRTHKCMYIPFPGAPVAEGKSDVPVKPQARRGEYQIIDVGLWLLVLSSSPPFSCCQSSQVIKRWKQNR